MPSHLSDSCLLSIWHNIMYPFSGKASCFRKISESNQFQKLTTIFLDLSANKGNIRDAGEQLMFSITGATKKKKTMDEKRLADYFKNLGEKSAVKPELLGPTSDATAKTLRKGLSHRSKLVQKRFTTCRMGMKNVECDVPTCKMTRPPASHELLKIIKCGCKIECTTRCT